MPHDSATNLAFLVDQRAFVLEYLATTAIPATEYIGDDWFHAAYVRSLDHVNA